MNVTMEVPGNISFSYTVDIPKGDLRRGFFFYVDDTVVEDVEVRCALVVRQVTQQPMTVERFCA